MSRVYNILNEFFGFGGVSDSTLIQSMADVCYSVKKHFEKTKKFEWNIIGFTKNNEYIFYDADFSKCTSWGDVVTKAFQLDKKTSYCVLYFPTQVKETMITAIDDHDWERAQTIRKNTMKEMFFFSVWPSSKQPKFVLYQFVFKGYKFDSNFY